MLQRKCACGGTPGPTGECENCRKKREAKEQSLQRAAVDGSSVGEVPSIVHEVLGSPGQPLDTKTRARLEPHFGGDFSQVKTNTTPTPMRLSLGADNDVYEQEANAVAERVTGSTSLATENYHDFSNVRIHTDTKAAASARAVNALAYTVGQDVVFGAGQYQPHSHSGFRLLAHELTHVTQQAGAYLQRAPNTTQSPDAPAPDAPDSAADKAAQEKATGLETDILSSDEYKKLPTTSKERVKEIIAAAKTKPPGDAKGQRNYYLSKLKIAITTPFAGTESGKEEYGCSSAAEKKNREAVEKALDIEKRWWDGLYADVEETAVASGTTKVARTGQGGKKFQVDRSDPKNIRVQMKVKLNGKADEVASIQKLEDAIERASHTKGYYLDIVFVDKSGPDVFEFKVKFCEWANAGNWASGPSTLSHEVHHALGLDDRYDYIESHAANTQMNVPMRLKWFAEQMKKITSPRDPFSKMSTNTNPLLAEDVCAVAFENKAEQKKCVEARKDLGPSGIPAP